MENRPSDQSITEIIQQFQMKMQDFRTTPSRNEKTESKIGFIITTQKVKFTEKRRHNSH